MNHRISSIRPANAGRQYGNETPSPMSTPNCEYRRRPNERLFEATVSSVDVTCEYRGITHQLQMSTPYGRTVSVNRQGEPRM